MADQTPNDKERAYFAMTEYLNAYYERGGSDEIAGLLGGMQFLADGQTADPACWSDRESAWERSCGKTKADYPITFTK